ncbi:hypothetical protein C8J55DRAFT_484241 [Lentinula edodes]|uniref:Uncharacterized protein n=1 Tax=Lentinula lateritia TaxID=40482 RepID=A0A9W9E1A6_9AGAR|nr:hypothetical protein C8J55DRAFT_484241 [Lentinula edodes]
MSFVGSHTGSVVYPSSAPSSVVYPGSSASGVVYSGSVPGVAYSGSPASGVVYPSSTYTSSSYGHVHHAPTPGSYYSQHGYPSHNSVPMQVPMQHNFYGAPPVAMPSYVAPMPAYHRSSYSVPYSYGSPYAGYSRPAGTTAGRLAVADTGDIITKAGEIIVSEKNQFLVTK